MNTFVAICIFILGLKAHAEGTTLTKAEVESIGSSVGAVISDGGAPFCTAFLVHPQILMGISHCNEPPAPVAKFIRFSTGAKQSYRIRSIFQMSTDGVALYRVEEPVLDRPLLKLSAGNKAIHFPLAAIGFPTDWPNENSVKISLPKSERGLRVSWSDGTYIVDIEQSCTVNKLVLDGSGISNKPTILNATDSPYISGSSMSGGPVFDSSGKVVGIHTCEDGGFYSSQDALETLSAMRLALDKGDLSQRVVTLPGGGRKFPPMRLAFVDTLGVKYAPDFLSLEILDFIFNNSVE